MSRTGADRVVWSEAHQSRTVALNVSARWVTMAVELILGFVMLPFNMRYLGAADYGLWMLAASIVAYFPVMNLGYAGALDRFIAHYRAKGDSRAINEIASTFVVVFAAIGAVALGIIVVVALNVGTLFSLSEEQAPAGGAVLMLVGLQFAVGLPFAPFGAVVNGFQRSYLNGIVGTAVSIAVALVNVAVLIAGGGLVELIAAMTATRLLGYIAYRMNGYRVFPLLRLRLSLFRSSRLREVTGFSVYMLLQSLSNRVNYASDPIVIAAFLSTGAVAMWTVAQRLADMVLRLTNQLNDVLFPVVVDCDSSQRDDRLRELLVQGTRMSLALVLPVAGALILLAEPVILAWTGPTFRDSSVLLQLLGLAVLARVATNTAGIVLRGAGHHKLLATSNMAAAVVNIGLSVILIRTHGLPGVALATLVPITIRGAAVLVPVACRRVGISLRYFVAEGVWPAVWPAAISLGALWLVRDSVSPALMHALLHGAAAGALYGLLFLGIAIGRRDRRRYLIKLRSIAGLPALERA